MSGMEYLWLEFSPNHVTMDIQDSFEKLSKFPCLEVSVEKVA